MIRKRFALLFACSIILVSFLGITTDPRLSALTSTHDKIAHTSVFFIETVLFTLVFSDKSICLDHILPLRLRRILSIRNDVTTSRTLNKYFISFVVCSVIASIGSELGQAAITRGKRQFDLYDILCNFIGSTLGVVLVYRLES